MARPRRHIELYADRKDRWRFRIKNANGEITGPSQAYSTKGNAKRAAVTQHPSLPVED